MDRSIPKPAYVTTLTDAQWRNLPLPERVCHVARGLQRLGIREVHGRANWGGWITRFLQAVRIRKPAPWCAAFVTFCLMEAGADMKRLPANPASVWEWFEWADDRGRIRATPARGRLMFWGDGPGKRTHIGIVLGQDITGRVRTIEGNTDGSGSRDGDGVYERLREPTHRERYRQFGYIDLSGLMIEGDSSQNPALGERNLTNNRRSSG